MSNSGGRGTIGGETHPPTHGAQTMQGSPEKIDKRALERVGAGGPERGGRQEFSPLVRGCLAVTSAALRSCVWMWSFVFGCGCLCSAGAVCGPLWSFLFVRAGLCVVVPVCWVVSVLFGWRLGLGRGRLRSPGGCLWPFFWPECSFFGLELLGCDRAAVFVAGVFVCGNLFSRGVAFFGLAVHLLGSGRG